ncbi:MAG: glycosyltransferase [Amaricoccus sp.]|uniref:glycosyltransferase n=1 Tax=Amaricoccus sp. TaxID=1872485 RepID=UPI003314795C
MNIAYLVNTYPQPSHSFIRREIQALERRGIAVHRFAMRGARARLVDPGDLAEDDRTEHVLSAGAPRLAFDTLAQIARAPGRSLAALRLAIATGRRAERGVSRHLVYFVEACHVVARCRALGIDHLHAHFGTNSASVAMLARLLGGPAYSFTVHGPEEFDAPVALSLGDKMRHAAFTVAISSFGRSQLCRWSDLDGWARIKVVHCGVEPARFATPAPIPAGPETRLVAIGRLVEQKGQLLLVEAMAHALREHPALRLTLVGDGELRGPIEAAITARGLTGRVTITGWVDEARVRDELAAAHALVMPSFAEGLPMVVMEAMAAGRPVIATAIAGVPELVVPGETGWLVPAGDPEALARAMVALAGTPRDRLAAMGAAGRARPLDRHDIDREAGRLAELMGAVPAVGHMPEVASPPTIDAVA